MTTQDTTFVPNSTNFTAQMAQPLNDSVWKGRNPIYTTSTGSGSAYVVTLPSGSLSTSIVPGDRFTWKAHTTNTGPATLTIVGSSSLGAKPMYNGAATPLVNGQLPSGTIVTATYDGNVFQITIPTVSGGTIVVPPGVLKGSGGSLATALNSDLPTMTSTVGGAVPTPPNNTTTFLRGDGTFATPAGGGVDHYPYPYLNVRDYGAVGDGVTNDTAAIQAAINAAASKTLFFPNSAGPYYLGSNVTMSDPVFIANIVMDAGVSFAGPGKMPTVTTNSVHQIKQGTYLHSVVSGGVLEDGNQTFAAEIDTQGDYKGNAVAIYGGCRTPGVPFAGFIWALNTVTRFNPGTFTGNGVGYELDMDNFNSTGKGQALLVTGVGSYSCQAALVIQRADSTSDWQYGAWIKNFQQGIVVDGGSSSSPVSGVTIRGVEKDLLKIIPRSDSSPSNAAMYVANAAESQVNWQVTKRGGQIVGSGGTEVTKYLSSMPYVGGFGTITAGTTAEVSVSFSGVNPGDQVVGSPTIALAGGCFWNLYCASANVVTIRIINASPGDVDPDGGGGSNWRISVWKH